MAPDHNVRHLGPTPAGSEQSTPRAFYDQSWALVIGISAYQDPQARLANARNDAEAVAKLLKETYHFEHVTLLCDAEATHDAILGWLRDQLPAQVGSNDRFVFFFAGHGTSRTGSTGQVRGYLMPQDAELGKYASYIDMEEVRNACGWIGAKHIFLILDCCFSGIAAITTRATLPARPARVTDAYFQRITELPAWQVLTAGASDELVADSGSRPGHSAFTGAVLGGLEGWADDDGDGIITASDLAEYVRQTVSHETASGRTRQFPYFNYLMGSGQGDYVFTRPGRSILPTSPSLPTLGGPSGGGRPLPPRSLRLWGLSAVIILIIVGGMVSRWTNIWGIWDRWPQAEATAAYATAQPTTAAAVGEATSTAAVAALIFPPTPSPAPTLTFPPRPSPVSTLATPIWSQFATAVAGATDEPAPPEPSPTPQPEETSPDDYIAALRAAIPLFTDDFSQESADWVANRFDGMDYAIADGELQIGVEIPNSLGWSILDQRQRDFYLEVDTTYLGDPAIEEHGVLFRYVDPQNFYFFAVSATGEYSLWRLHQNEWQPLEDWTLTDALDLTPGATNRLGLLVEGEQVTLWINDQRVVETGDDTFPAGAVGLAVGTFDEVGARAAFDNVTIWGVEATAASPGAGWPESASRIQANSGG